MRATPKCVEPISPGWTRAAPSLLRCPYCRPPDASIPPTGHQAAGGGARTCGRPSSIGAVLEPTQLAWIPACAGMTEGGAGMTERGTRRGRMRATPKCVEPISPGWTRAAPSLLRCPCCRPPDASIPPTGHQAAGGALGPTEAVQHRRRSRTHAARLDSCLRRNDGEGAGMTEGARNDGGGRGNDGGGGRGNGSGAQE